MRQVDNTHVALPPGSYIRQDAELFTLHRDDGSKVASFEVSAAPSEVVREAERDYRATGKAALLRLFYQHSVEVNQLGARLSGVIGRKGKQE